MNKREAEEKVRACYCCKGSLSFEEFLESAGKERSEKELKALWESPHVELLCCGCYQQLQEFEGDWHYFVATREAPLLMDEPAEEYTEGLIPLKILLRYYWVQMLKFPHNLLLKIREHLRLVAQKAKKRCKNQKVKPRWIRKWLIWSVIRCLHSLPRNVRHNLCELPIAKGHSLMDMRYGLMAIEGVQKGFLDLGKTLNKAIEGGVPMVRFLGGWDQVILKEGNQKVRRICFRIQSFLMDVYQGYLKHLFFQKHDPSLLSTVSAHYEVLHHLFDNPEWYFLKSEKRTLWRFFRKYFRLYHRQVELNHLINVSLNQIDPKYRNLLIRKKIVPFRL